MYITEVVRPYANGKSSRCVLLRESYRHHGKVKNRTLANLTALPGEAIEAIKQVLRQPKKAPSESGTAAGAGVNAETPPQVVIEQGLSIGALATVYQMAQRLGIESVLGRSHQGKLALWQVLARVIQPGSRLASVRLAREHAACDLLGITEPFCEDDLYANLAWLSARQLRLEKALFARQGAQAAELFLYDVTSSYLEGEHNALGAYGYNRDKKRGKQQIVVGLLTDAEGEPVSVEVFQGNTQDVSTLSAQIHKLAHAFGCQRVTLVGDRGMIKQMGIEALQGEDFFFISAITKPQIETLLKAQVIEMSQFDQVLVEVLVASDHSDHSNEPGPRPMRYILKRNPVRAQQLADNRQHKKAAVSERLQACNERLQNSSRAHLAVARRQVCAEIKKLKLHAWLRLRKRRGQRQLYLIEDEAARVAQSQLDGCYVGSSRSITAIL